VARPGRRAPAGMLRPGARVVDGRDEAGRAEGGEELVARTACAQDMQEAGRQTSSTMGTERGRGAALRASLPNVC
jgi:hypothetical protein